MKKSLVIIHSQRTVTDYLSVMVPASAKMIVATETTAATKIAVVNETILMDIINDMTVARDRLCLLIAKATHKKSKW